MSWAKHHVERETHRLQKMLGLGLWDIYIQWADLADDELLAQCWPTDGTLSGIIEYSTSILKRPWKNQQLTILHELLHMSHQELVEAFRLQREVPMDDVARALLEETFRNREERYIDQMSRVLQPLI